LTRRRGLSIEFDDYREYAEGDDLRHLDWSVLARMGRPTVKTYRDEEDLPVHLLIDGSASMQFGEPSKFSFAQRFAAAAGYMGLTGHDAVRAVLLGKRDRPPRPLRGRASYGKLSRQIEAMEAGAKSPVGRNLSDYAAANRSPGLTVFVSDGLDPALPSAFRHLMGRGRELWMVQILSRIELDPDLEGDLRLVDSETGNHREITANSATLRRYRDSLGHHIETLREAVKRSGGTHVLVATDTPFPQALAEVFRQSGLAA
jgi:uncharacterized protein (DUF58 family)